MMPSSPQLKFNLVDEEVLDNINNFTNLFPFVAINSITPVNSQLSKYLYNTILSLPKPPIIIGLSMLGWALFIPQSAPFVLFAYIIQFGASKLLSHLIETKQISEKNARIIFSTLNFMNVCIVESSIETLKQFFISSFPQDTIYQSYSKGLAKLFSLSFAELHVTYCNKLFPLKSREIASNAESLENYFTPFWRKALIQGTRIVVSDKFDDYCFLSGDTIGFFASNLLGEIIKAYSDRYRSLSLSFSFANFSFKTTTQSILKYSIDTLREKYKISNIIPPSVTNLCNTSLVNFLFVDYCKNPNKINKTVAYFIHDTFKEVILGTYKEYVAITLRQNEHHPQKEKAL